MTPLLPKYVNNDFNMSNEYLLVTIIIHKYINYYTLKTHNTLGFNNTYKITQEIFVSYHLLHMELILQVQKWQE